MKNISYIINGVLAVAIIVLFVLFFSSEKKGSEGGSSYLKIAEGDSTGVLPVAYVNIDSLVSNYTLYDESNTELMAEQTKINATAEQKHRQLKDEYDKFQKKVQINAFLTQEKGEEEAKRIQNLEVSIQNQMQKLEKDYMEKQSKMNQRISDSIRVNLEDYNKKANFQIIFSNTPMTKNILVAKDSYDITNAIILQMNNRYKKEATK